MDLTDRKILYELDLNCRQSNSQIAKKLKVSKDVINYRIRNLEEKGYIAGYRAVIDISKLGYQIFRIYIKFQDTFKEIEDEIIAYLNSHQKVWWLGRLAGRVDIAFAFWSRTNHEFYDFWVGFLKKYRKYIKSEQISTFVEYIHFGRAYIIDLEKDVTEPVIVGSEQRAKFDDTDWMILSILANNARTPLLEIAQKTGLTPMAVKYRVKNLEQNKIIQAYKALIDFTKLGHEYYKVDMYLEDMSKLKEVEALCQMHPNIVYLDRTFGAGDIEFDFEVKNLAHFMQIMDEIKEQFKGIIRNFEYFSVLKIYKTLYFPIK